MGVGHHKVNVWAVVTLQWNGIPSKGWESRNIPSCLSSCSLGDLWLVCDITYLPSLFLAIFVILMYVSHLLVCLFVFFCREIPTDAAQWSKLLQQQKRVQEIEMRR